jgi:hypothetical protein
MKKLFLLWVGSVLVSLVLNGQVYGMEWSETKNSGFERKDSRLGGDMDDFDFDFLEQPHSYEDEIYKLLERIEPHVKKIEKQEKTEKEKELFILQLFMKEVNSKGSPELKEFIQNNLPKDSPFRKKSFWKNHGDKVILGTAIVSAAIMGYWSSELESLIVKHKKIVVISLALLLFGGVGCYCLKNCKDGGLWKTIKKDAESLKNVTKILTLVLPPATYLAFRSIFKKKEPTIEI